MKRRKGIQGYLRSTLLLTLTFIAVFMLLQFNAVAGEIDELKIAIGVDCQSFNPNEIGSAPSHNMCELIQDTYFAQDSKGNLIPHLATGYTTSPDGKTLTLHLRKGVKYFDGTEMKADSVKVAFDRVLDPKLRASLRYMYSPIKKVKIIDDYTLEFSLKYPFAPLISSLSLVSVSPFSQKAREKYGEDIRRHPVGAGPYKLAEWVKGDHITFIRNENYYGKKPTVKKIIWLIVPEVSTREAMLKSGDVDVCFKPAPSNLAKLKATKGISVASPMSTRSIFFELNTQRFRTKSKLVRKALNYAVDKKAIVKNVLFNQGKVADDVLSPLLFGYGKMDYAYEYNPKKAKELLKKANFDFSKPLKMLTPQGRYLFDKQVAEAVQMYFQAIGIKTELRVMEWPTYVASLRQPLEKQKCGVNLLGWGPIIMDGDMTLYGQFHTNVNPPKGLGCSFYSNPAYDKLVEESRREQNRDKRRELMIKASKLVWDDCPWLFLHIERFVLAYKSKFQGLNILPTERFYPTYMTTKP